MTLFDIAEAIKDNAKATREWTEANKPRFALDEAYLEETELRIAVLGYQLREYRRKEDQAEQDVRMRTLIEESLGRAS